MAGLIPASLARTTIAGMSTALIVGAIGRGRCKMTVKALMLATSKTIFHPVIPPSVFFTSQVDRPVSVAIKEASGRC
jgi:hypothetical protein